MELKDLIARLMIKEDNHISKKNGNPYLPSKANLVEQSKKPL